MTTFSKFLTLLTLSGGLLMSQEVIKEGSLGGFKGDAKIFSGEVNVKMAFPKNEWRPFSGGFVTFSPSARSAWHTHPIGQTLVVTEGSIYTGTQEGITQIAKKGDVISCPPNVKHWHGAGPKESGTHLALTGYEGESNVVWLEKVSDEEYQKAIKGAK